MYLIGYLDKVVRPFVLILPKMSGYVKTFKVKDGDEDKNHKLMSFSIDDEKLLTLKAINFNFKCLNISTHFRQYQNEWFYNFI